MSGHTNIYLTHQPVSWCLTRSKSCSTNQCHIPSVALHLTEHFKTDLSVDNNQGTCCVCSIPAQCLPVSLSSLPRSKKQQIMWHHFSHYCEHYEISNIQMWSFSCPNLLFFCEVALLTWHLKTFIFKWPIGPLTDYFLCIIAGLGTPYHTRAKGKREKLSDLARGK